VASKTKRRDAGSGALYQDARGFWTATVELPPATDGKRRRKVIRAKDKGVAQAKLRELRRELDRAGDLATSSPTVETWMRTWLDRIARPRLKPNTLTTYRGQVDRYIIPAIGRIRLDKLTPAHVRRVHDLASDGRSSTTALQAHRILAKALKDAEREGRVTRNVAALVDAPRKAASTRGALTVGEARALLLSVSDDAHAAARWSVALLAGLRQGEALGLTRTMVDLERVAIGPDGQPVPAPVITVSWQLQRLRWEHGCGPGPKTKANPWPCGRRRAGSCPQRHVDIPPDQEVRQVYGGLWLTRPKSRAGWREVPVAPHLRAVLERYFEQMPPGDEGLIFHRPDGHPIDPSDDAEAWDRALKAAGLPDVPLHSARHTTATLLHALGVSERVRVTVLGHSSATVTAGYTHVTDAEAAEGMGRLGALVLPSA